jgi:hypothetical protein
MPIAPGSFDFTAQVADATGATANKAFHLTIGGKASSLVITTGSPLPAATVGGFYSALLAATGGDAPYSWSLTSGALPPGLTVNRSSGSIAGSPTSPGSFTFSVRVTDSDSNTSDKYFSLAVAAAPAVPTLSILGVPASAASTAQVPFSLTLSAPYTKAIAGQVTLVFQPSAAVSRDDPAIQFSTGGRTVTFTIPAGSAQAVFPAGAMAFQTGTVAGTIALSANSDLLATATASTVVGADVPTITKVSVVQKTSGFQVEIAGFSNSRELADASFQFTASSGQAVQTGDLTVTLQAPAGAWFSSDSSTPFGGQFLLAVPFTLQQGAASGLASVSVKLQNSKGPSLTVGTRF